MVAMELADFRQRRGEHAHGYVLDHRLCEMSADLGELKAVERETRLERFAVRISGTRVEIGGCGFAKIRGVQLAVVVQTLCVADLNQRAARCAQLHAQASHEILTEVVDEPSGTE